MFDMSHNKKKFQKDSGKKNLKCFYKITINDPKYSVDDIYDLNNGENPQLS